MTSASPIRSRWLPRLLPSLLALATFAADAQLPTRPGPYGKTLLMDVVLPPSQIDSFATFLGALAATNKGTANSAVFGDTADWLGDAMTADSTTNPYTIVVSVDATAKAAGDMLAVVLVFRRI